MAPPALSTYMICGPLPIVSSLGVFVPPKDPAKDGAVSPEPYIPQDSKAWPSHSSISYTFLDGKPLNWQLELVQRAITEYTRYANVNLIRTPKDKDESADIRISFKCGGGAWSAIGTDALKIAKGVATMNLGFLSIDSGGSGPQTTGDRELTYNLILHQLGHTFGLAHEWQDGWVQVRRGHGNAILEQHIAVFKETEEQGTSNFQEPDEKSIMRFFIPANYYLDSGKLVGPNGLSDRDKAWLTLIYPGKAAVGADEETGILHALNVLDIPLDVSSRILLSPTVSQMRFHYQENISKLWGDVLSAKAVKDTVRALQEKVKVNSSALEDLKLEFDVMEGKITGTTPLVDHNYEDDLYDSVAAAVLDPQFSAILANAVNQDDDGQPGAQNFVKFNPLQNYYMSGINPQASPDVQRFIGPLLTSLVPALLPMLGKLIFSALPPDAMSGSGMYSHGLPPNVEQGIFSAVTKFLNHPTFLAIVRDIASDMIDRNDQS
ncbi:hypothetical protein JVT61DRAFT_4858 [Boletus reticuloceps]|uniref:Uncharacterized protein n=1 Tax=Boletus reticuloceps TaxID=495285 RepID=A0A8I2YLP6_9AGAM|nr:hypothetical protein JVT61DRAFT_4858 [Boletus reticuloceps]